MKRLVQYKLSICLLVNLVFASVKSKNLVQSTTHTKLVQVSYRQINDDSLSHINVNIIIDAPHTV